jgi:hypothetical protein
LTIPALISTLCWRAAYNEGYGFWVIDSKLAGEPVLVTDSASDYSDGLISLGQRGRGIGDCWASAEWVWDGKAFTQSSESTTGMCRYIRAGGTWISVICCAGQRAGIRHLSLNGIPVYPFGIFG